MIDFIYGMGRRNDKLLYTLTFLLETIKVGDIRTFRLLFNLWLLYFVEVVTTCTKALHLVLLVFSSAEAIDSIWTKDWHESRP